MPVTMNINRTESSTLMHYSLFEQLHQDISQQQIHEQRLAQFILYNKKQSFDAFKNYCPGLLPLVLQELTSQRFALFCNRFGKAGVIDHSTKSAVYGYDPQTEAITEVADFISAAPFIELDSNSVASEVDTKNTTSWPSEPLPVQPDVVLMFGLGLGLQLIPLLTQTNIRCLVIYEPDNSMFQCSLQAANWDDIFSAAARSNTLLSLQICQDASNVTSDLNELWQYFPGLNKVYLYRHLSDPVMDEVVSNLFQNRDKKSQLLKSGQQYLGYQHPDDYLPLRFNAILGNKIFQTQLSDEQQKLFQQNLAVFSRYYPAIAELVKNFTPLNWKLVVDHNGNFNIWHSKRNALLFLNPQREAYAAVTHFLHQPIRDDVILGQKVPWKFRHYVHYKAISKLQSLFTELAQRQTSIPYQIDSLILFGIGQGSFLTELLRQRDIKNLYICEPNVEHFFASFYVTDWKEILLRAEQDGKRVYFNIGGDGSDYFNDLMQQFYNVGAFTIANTYLLQSTSNPALGQAIKKLKAQLGIVLTIGDYYDHARFGISHTYSSFINGHNWLKADRSSYRQHRATQIPVFVVGNGPSLDQCADYIKEHRAQVVVVSCGTALKPLYQLGITPDFHAEVEQNRSTYKWITQVNDVSYLKRIKLLSVNGVHPDTAALFDSTYLAFKEGEASTTLFNEVFGAAQCSAHLTFAYPTVSNLAINWLLEAGFKQLYLLGVDLGYIDANSHHSRLSGYYKEDGSPTYDYVKVHGDTICITGNFRPFVQTKIEFDVSRQVIEQTLKAYAGQSEIYNCSDGAYIEGAVPLQPAQILTFKPDFCIKTVLDDFLQQCCFKLGITEKLSEFEAFYNDNLLNQAIEVWCRLIAEPIKDFDSAKRCIDRQWELFKQQASQPGTIIFYLLYGSTSYFLSLMTKLLPALAQSETELSEQALQQFNTILLVWREYLNDVADDFRLEPLKVDTTS